MPEQRLQLKLLSEESLTRIEETAYRLLAEVGISLQHAAAREMLYGHGCQVHHERVLIPRQVVEGALANLTPYAEYLTMAGQPAFRLGDGQIRFHNGGGPPFIYDLDSGQRRSARLQDIIDMTRVLDALPHVDVVMPLFFPEDVPPPLLGLAATEVTLRHSRKPVMGAAVDKPEQVPFMLELAAACCGGMERFRQRPTMSVYISPVSPLIFTEEVTAAIMAVAESGAGFHSLPAPSLGATGPITVAGALAQQHAEVLASFVIAAAARPGTPVVYCSRINPIDLRTAMSSWGGPEVGLAGACAGQLAHRLGLPVDAYGFCTSATQLDPQFAYERLANAFIPALTGVDIMSGVGIIDSGLAGGLEVAIIDDEMISLLKHIVGGVTVDEESLALEVMRQVIPADGVFLSELHTVKQMRKGALWLPGVSERTGGSAGDSEGVVARARARARQILATHPVEPLPEDVSRHLAEIMTRARRELVPA
ncbi:MAG: trimethylamine methyltransferase family protein [Chloroflexota bacterium]